MWLPLHSWLLEEVVMDTEIDQLARVRKNWLTREVHELAREQAVVELHRAQIVDAATKWGMLDVIEGR